MAELAELRPVVATAMNDRSNPRYSTTSTTNHHHHPTANANISSTSSTTTKYSGGFSSSICLGLFQHHADQHSDGCALACCGMFLADRNRYLLTQQLPPPLWQRIFQYVVIPIALMVLILICISPTTMPNATKAQIQSARILPIFITLVCLTWLYYCQAVSKRREIRLMIQQRLLQQQSGGGNTTTSPLDLSDIEASHPGCCCCGCYPRDRTRASYATNADEYDLDYNSSGKPVPARDVCYGLWNLLANMCCGWFCNCWCQCFGMCALAQEDRELQLLLSQVQPLNPTSTTATIVAPFQRDYITMQPYSEYYPRIQRVRQQHLYSLWEHGKASSQLSSHLLKWVLGVLGLVVISSLIPIHNWIKPLQLLVVFGTLGQAVVLLFVVHWIYHRFDLSLDAVIKFFASGFCLCTGMAMLYEVLVSLGFGIVLLFIKIIIVVIDTASQHQAVTDDGTSTPSDYYKDYFTEFDRHHLGLAIFGAFINAYFVAAAVEELTKYFSFWMVEHPDFMKSGNPEFTLAAGATNANGNGTGAEGTTYETIDLEGQPITHYAPQDTTAMVVAHNDYTLSTSPINGGGSSHNNHDSPMSTASLSTIPRRTNLSLGAATTVAMVATSLGFACAENLLYVFAYSPPGFANEVATLVARCIFPVHPLCAALQSLGVVHRDLVLPDGKMTFGLGRVLLPAWLLHGTFDFVLMAAAAYVNFKVPPKTSTDDEINDNSSSSSSGQEPSAADEQVANVANLISLVISVVLVVLGFVYYQCASHRQRRQLRALDDNEAAEEAAVMEGENGAARPQDESASWLI